MLCFKKFNSGPLLKYDCETGWLESTPDVNDNFVEHKMLQISDILYFFSKSPLTAYKLDIKKSEKTKVVTADHRRSGFALANYQNTDIYISGGLVPCGGPTNSVLRLSIKESKF